jgi:mono/diheme cytochrome c family protein
MTAYRSGAAAMAAAAGLLMIAVTAGRAADNPAPAAATDPVPAMLASPPDVERGRALFVGTCSAYCHRPTPGPAPAPFLFDCEWLHGGSDAEIFHTIAKGVPNTQMVAFGSALPDQDVWRLVAYLRSASVCKK